MLKDPESWDRVKKVLNLVLDAAPEARRGVVTKACAGDSALQGEVESLLSYADQTGRLDDCLRETVRDAIGSAAQAPARIGPYRVERELGSGGMGTVYVGVRDDDELPARVALKVIQTAGSQALFERFYRERRILAGLIHPYIVRLLDAGKLENGQPYFVMEYVEGQPIDQYTALHRQTVLELFLKVCSGVQFAHQNLVIHRDLKPGNILVTENGDPRLLDFGIAKLLTAESFASEETTQPWERMLTPSSASPEQASGEAVTVASDVYSLGVLLYRLLTGVSPYVGAKDFAGDPARVIRQYEPPPASTVANVGRRERGKLRGDLDNILQKALEKDPRRRYPTVHEFAADIERYRKGLPVEARAASFSYRTMKFVRRNRLAVTAAALLCLTMAAGVVASSLYARRAHMEQVHAQHELAALRKLTQSFLFEFDDAVQNLPGASQARELVVRRAVEYLDKLASESGDDVVLLNDLADAYTHIANIAGAFREARGASSLRSALENGLKALAIRRRLLSLNPGDEKLRVNLLDSMWKTAAQYSLLGDLRRSLELHQERLGMCERGVHKDSVDERFRLGASLTSVGAIERQLGHIDWALTFHRRCLAVRERLLAGDPDSARARRAVGISHEFLGYTLSAQQNYAAAADEQRKALAQFEPLVKADRNNADLGRLVGVTQENLCESLARSGATQEALGHCQAAIAAYRSMAEADPKNIQAEEDLASGESTFSLALDLSDSPREALDWQRQARRLFVSALARDPDSLDLAQENAESLMELAKLASDKNAAAEALKNLQNLAARVPESREFDVDLQRAQDLCASLR
jgi:eukaryotic-like serine/threonine-protein kinase